MQCFEATRADCYRARPQVADRGTTFRYEGQLQSKQNTLTNKQSQTNSSIVRREKDLFKIPEFTTTWLIHLQGPSPGIRCRKQRSSFVQVSDFDRGRTVAYRDCGLSFREIGSLVGRNQTAIMPLCDH
ncbi:hypothetical protein LAZ67_7001949 [Cordylochernes scorpioides]|uniref:Transposase IS30-like HTH domain-containing protein n=1 Tax=Cordylochernes scorpioides TaxID=51811 RepID=A0ABY6KSQ9_9ARAC|nr:hypothetical protein LAZ67_7001949 [Cordylochernes scorpioides]